jgi:PAS domain S-box-containing protein
MEYSLLIEAAQALLSIGDFEKAARSIFDACKKAIGAEAGYVALLSEDGSENKVLFLDPGHMPCTVDPSLPMPIRGLRESAYRTKKVVFDNKFKNSRWMEFMPAGHAPLENVMFAPMILEGEALGLLGLANKKGGFTEEDAKIAKVYADLAAISLMNSMTLQSLEDSEERFRSVAQTATDAVITVNSDGEVMFWNNGAARIFGYSSEEMMGKKLGAIMPERYWDRHESSMERAKQGVHTIIGKTVEVAAKRRDGLEFSIELSLACWSTREGIFYTSIIRDITERRLAEDAVIQANNRLNLLSQITRHDMINNMTILMAFENMAEEAATDPRQRTLLRTIKKTINDLNKQIEFTRTYQDFGVQMPGWIDLNDAFKREIDSMSDTRLSFTVDVGDIEIFADSMLGKVIHNLIDNAVRHGNKVTRIRVSVAETDAGLSVFFEDDGEGVPVPDKEKIFERGYGKHTGLGLYLVREILGITEIGIRENGEPGKGARFELLVPKVRYRHRCA